jgi:16S rRNA processing protein RimM
VGRPHGLDGSFHVTEPRPELLALGAPVRVGDSEAQIVRRAGTDARPIVRLEGCSGRESAEDLQGCRVVDTARDREIGSVLRLLALPSCEVLEVGRPGSADLLVPLVRDAVRAVDVDARVIDVDLDFLGEPGAGPARKP